MALALQRAAMEETCCGLYVPMDSRLRESILRRDSGVLKGKRPERRHRPGLLGLAHHLTLFGQQCLQFLIEFRQDLEQITDNAKIGFGEDGGFRILVDGHDNL